MTELEGIVIDTGCGRLLGTQGQQPQAGNGCCRAWAEPEHLKDEEVEETA